LVFREGHLLAAIRSNQWLVLDEMNRADLDRVLGPVLTFLARQPVELGPDTMSGTGKAMVLGWGVDPASSCEENGTKREYIAGSEWRFIGTYNDVDLGRVFTMGAALTRRWATIPVPPIDAMRIPEVLSKHIEEPLPAGATSKIQDLYSLHLEYLPMGPAPFVDMARYVVEEDSTATPTAGGTAVGGKESIGRRLLADAPALTAS
jgi:hypothetical protein